MTENKKHECEFSDRKEPHMHCRFCAVAYSVEEAVKFAAETLPCKGCGKTIEDAAAEDAAEQQQAELEGRAIINALRQLLGTDNIKGMLFDPTTGKRINLDDTPKRLN